MQADVQQNNLSKPWHTDCVSRDEKQLGDDALIEEIAFRKEPVQFEVAWQIPPGVKPVEELPEALIDGDSPDAVLRLSDSGRLAARCSLWWSGTPVCLGRKTGYIGHYAASDDKVSARLLDNACQLLQTAGAEQAIGPVDGSTWRRYRFITSSDETPPYFLEPTNPPDCAEQWRKSGFTTFARYFSSLSDLQIAKAADVGALEQRLRCEGVSIRPFEMSAFRAELQRLFRVCMESFAGNLLYAPIAEEEFMRQYEKLRSVIVPELALVAERNNQPVGFVLVLPDIENVDSRRLPDTVVLKTLARLPGRALRGLGELLLVRGQAAARQMGYSKIIHALMHESNNSIVLSKKYGSRIFREYQLFARGLDS